MQTVNSTTAIGTAVERINDKSYTGGRTGTTVEMDIEKGRARVCWTKEKNGTSIHVGGKMLKNGLRTWVRWQDLGILPQ